MNRHLFTINLEDWGMEDKIDVTVGKLCAVFAEIVLLLALVGLAG